jgi:hypothetical protein
MATTTKVKMLSTRELDEATRALVWPRFDGRRSAKAFADLQEAKNQYHADEKALEACWEPWLAKEYADGLSAIVVDELFRRAWDDGHSSGYHEVETYYQQYAEFALFIVKNA